MTSSRNWRGHFLSIAIKIALCYNQKRGGMMSKEYEFAFVGTKEDFINALKCYPNNTSLGGDKFYYFDDYIVKTVGDTIHFGVERCGHSGGYWFIPTITEYDDRIEFRGTVKYVCPADDRSKSQKVIDKIEEYLLYILLAPIVLVIYICVKVGIFFKWLKNKILNRPTIKPRTTEERLFYLMEHHLKCIRKSMKFNFNEPENTAVIACCHILDNGADILYVSHDAEDDMRQFLCGGTHKQEEARVVSLSEIFNHDNTIAEFANMPCGYIAERKRKTSKWKIKKR